MKQERINFSIILRIALSLVPIFFGMPTVAVVLCAYNIAMTITLIGPVTTLVSSLCAVCFSMFFCGLIAPGGELQGLYNALEAVLMGLGAGTIFVKRESFYKGVWISSGAYLVVSYINVMQESHKVGMSVAQFLTEAPFQSISVQISAMLSEMKLDETAIISVIELIKSTTIMIIPSMLIISSVLIGYAVMWFVKNSLNKLPIKEKIDHSFATIRMPKVMAVFMILSLVLSFVIKNEEAGFVLINVFAVLASLGFFSGMSVVDFYLRKKIKNIFGRLCIHLAIYFFSAFITGIIPFANIFIVYTLMGATDAFVNIRRLKKNAEETPKEEEEVHEEE
ncbi:MAG: DUF2232 domain-containing protein [Clostridia bacterium]|nr:DUF2232 domain-containing protein [Clostridia bacterium]